MEADLGLSGYQPDKELNDGTPPQETGDEMSKEEFEKGLWIEVYFLSVKAGNAEYEHKNHADQFLKDMIKRWGES